jgi:hypothetical protein
MRWWFILDLVAANFTQALMEARHKYPYDVLDLFICPFPSCQYSWELQFTQQYRHSQCLDLIPNGRTQFIMDMDHACRYEARGQDLEFGCDNMELIEPVEILGFGTCAGASAKTVFVEQCGWICKHGRPVSRCIYTIDPYGYYDLGDTLEGCYVDSLCLCDDATLQNCNQEARFIQCYRTEDALARLEAGEKLESVAGLDESNTTLEEKYGSLKQAYSEQQQELQQIEDDHEEVTDQLEDALKELEATREQHQAAVRRHSTSGLQNDDKLEEAYIVNEMRLSKVEGKLEAEILARKKSEEKLKQEKAKTRKLWIGLAIVSLGACAATGVALYYKKTKPRVVLVHGGGADEAGGQQERAVQNTTVVMGRAVQQETAKGDDGLTNVDLRTGTSTLDLAR